MTTLNIGFFGKAVLAATLIVATSHIIKIIGTQTTNYSIEYSQNSSIHSPTIDEFAPYQMASSTVIYPSNYQIHEDESPKISALKASTGWSVNRVHKSSLVARFD